MSLLLALTSTSSGVSGAAAWTEQNDVYALSGTSNAVAPPKKIGGDDVPRVEYWETRKQPKKHDEQLEKFIREQYEQITGKTTNEVREIIGDYDDDEEILLLLVL